MSDDSELLREIRDLLKVMAEPALAERDKKLRSALLQIVGKGKQKAEAVLLMDGTRSQATIRKACGIDVGHLSRLVKSLRVSGLIGEEANPKILFFIPPNFFDASKSEDE